MPLKALIIDDERLSVELLTSMLVQYCPEIEIVGTAANMEDGVALCKKLNPEVLFLDIELSGASGFDLLEQFPKQAFQTVFITAHKEYAMKAIKHMAIDYILKPLSKDELTGAVQKLLKRQMHQDEIRSNSDHYLEQRLIFPHYNGFKMVSLKDIVRLEASDNYTIIYLLGGEKIVASKTLKEFETNIKSDSFIRVHKSHMINLYHLKEYVSEDGYHAIMEDGHKVAVSKTKQSEFLERVDAFIRRKFH